MQKLKRAGKGFLRLFSGRKRVLFFGKKYCVKMYGKEQYRKKDGKGLQKLMPIVYIKGRYETPLYDHVLGDKRDSDKDEV